MSAFAHALRVRYAEVDAQGVVFNAHWLTYFDEAMTSFFEHLGYPPQQTWTEGGPFDVVVRHAEIDWQRPARFADTVHVEVEAARLGTTSFDLRFTARVAGETAAVATTTYVVIEPGTGAPRALPDTLRGRLTDATAGSG